MPPPSPPPSSMTAQMFLRAIAAFCSLGRNARPRKQVDRGDERNEGIDGHSRESGSGVGGDRAEHQRPKQLNQQVQTQLQQMQQGLTSIQQQQVTQDNPPPIGHTPQRRSLSECKSVSYLKVLGSRKEDFKKWNEKLINANTQSFGPEWRSSCEPSTKS